MRRLLFIVVATAAVSGYILLILSGPGDRAGRAETEIPGTAPAEPDQPPDPRALLDVPGLSTVPVAARDTADQRLVTESARTAWAYVQRFDDARTGLIPSVAWYPYATVWDMGSMLAALHAGHALGFTSDSAYHRRMTAALRRIGSLDLAANTAPNKFYRTDTGALTERQGEPSHTGYGWSAVDIGRLLVWLAIVAEEHDDFRVLATAAAGRFALAELTEQAQLWGGMRAGERWQRYQEGRLGYEQYAAAGFELWGRDVSAAADPFENTERIEVLDVPLLVDTRSASCLTSEPFILWALELGLPGWADRLASSLLRVQEERHTRTGTLTMVSEDAITVAPHYFYYSCVHGAGEDFTVLTAEYERARGAPRTISTKAAFAWYALHPDEYTSLAVRRVAGAARREGLWAAGLTEEGMTPLGAANINTSAVILQAALYIRDGLPLMERVRSLR
ncbi:hypothetical protein BH23GEM9_BH23GEM9_00300 [soil metagenome]